MRYSSVALSIGLLVLMTGCAKSGPAERAETSAPVASGDLDARVAERLQVDWIAALASGDVEVVKSMVVLGGWNEAPFASVGQNVKNELEHRLHDAFAEYQVAEFDLAQLAAERLGGPPIPKPAVDHVVPTTTYETQPGGGVIRRQVYWLRDGTGQTLGLATEVKGGLKVFMPLSIVYAVSHGERFNVPPDEFPAFLRDRAKLTRSVADEVRAGRITDMAELNQSLSSRLTRMMRS